MRVRKINLSFVLLGVAFLSLAACSGSDWRSPGQMQGRPLGEVVTPRAQAGSDFASAPKRVLTPAATGENALAPGAAALDSVLAATDNFCKRQGGLAAMTREGCLASLSRLEQVFSSRRSFANPEDCAAYVRTVQNDGERIIAAQRLWCARNFENLHDRQGCYDAASAFLENFSEEAFCRNGSVQMTTPDQSVPIQAEPQRHGATGTQRVKYLGLYIEGYEEPGQKFDSPKEGRMPGAQKGAAKSKAAPQPKAPAKATGQAVPPVQTAPGQKAAPAVQTPAVQPPAVQPAKRPSAGQPASKNIVSPVAPAPVQSVLGGSSSPTGPAGPTGSTGAGDTAPGKSSDRSTAVGVSPGGSIVRQAIEPPSLSAGDAAAPEPGIQAPASPSPGRQEAVQPQAVQSAVQQPAIQPSAVQPAQSSAGAPAQTQIRPVEQIAAPEPVQPASSPNSPVEAAIEIIGPSGAEPAAALAPERPEEIPAWPQVQDLSVSPAQEQPYLPGQQSLNATTGPNAVSPGAVPEGVRAALGDEAFPALTQGEVVMPVLPTLGDMPITLEEPIIGQREELKPLPPVPAIGRIAPQLMPGVPPDTAVMDNTLPPQEEAVAPPATQIPAATPVDAFSDIIPNFIPPPPPNPYDTSTAPMPVSGTPAGQAGS